MLLMGNILIPLIVAPFKSHLFQHENMLYSSEVVFFDKDTNILKMYVHLLLIAKLNSKLYIQVSYFDNFRLHRQSSQIKLSAKHKCFTVLSLFYFNRRGDS